jgi:hypothetical protein
MHHRSRGGDSRTASGSVGSLCLAWRQGVSLDALVVLHSQSSKLWEKWIHLRESSLSCNVQAMVRRDLMSNSSSSRAANFRRYGSVETPCWYQVTWGYCWGDFLCFTRQPPWLSAELDAESVHFEWAYTWPIIAASVSQSSCRSYTMSESIHK